MGGYWNKVLRINLTLKKITTEEVPDTVWKQCLGGAGYGAKVLLDETSGNTSPFSPDNPIIFAVGPYNCGGAPGNGKWSVVTKSPLTGTHLDSAATASWGIQLKKAGYDALVVTGKSSSPVYLVINDDSVEIKNAKQLWGQDSFEVVDSIRELENNRKLSVVSIGPAGEKKVAIACIVADAHSFAGRGGAGAVMGSKGLKAIAVFGTQKTPLHDAEKFKSLSKKWFKNVYESAMENGFREHGTPSLPVEVEEFGDMPIKNWSGDVYPEGAARLGAPNYTTVLKAKPNPCRNCPVGCHRLIDIPEGKYAMKGPGPEYETLGMLGANLLIDDPKAVSIGNDICNRLGIDTISAGASIGLAMECYERGLLTEDQAGMKVTWGDPDVMLSLVKQIGNREGFGEIFAEGTLKAAPKIHPQAELYVSHVKGMELAAHDARSSFSLAWNYATGTRGACHMRGVPEDVEMAGWSIPEIGITEDFSEFFKMENKVELAILTQDLAAFTNSLVVCIFMSGCDLTYTAMLDMLNAATGWNWTVEDAMKCSSRIFTMQRLLNIRDGHNRKTDTLPARMQQPAEQGFRAGQTASPIFEEGLDKYYVLRKWDTDGIPTTNCLTELGLTEYGD